MMIFGPWFVSNEGELIIKRSVFVDGQQQGYELLQGDYKTIAKLAQAGYELITLANHLNKKEN